MRCAIIGDILLDHNIFVKAKKVASEGPVIAFEEQSEEFSIGGAANVAAMCMALGAKVLLCGVIGIDSSQDRISNKILGSEIENGFEYRREYATTVKKRYFDVRDGQRHLVARFDRDCQYQCTPDDEQLFFQRIKSFSPDAVIIQDHGKGVVTPGLVDRLAKDFDCYIDPTKATHVPSDPAVWVGSDEETPRMLGQDFVWIKKMGSDGIKFVGKEDSFCIPALARTVKSTCGAGDTFLAGLVFARTSGESWRRSCDFSSVAAAVQVERDWISPVTIKDMEQWISLSGS